MKKKKIFLLTLLLISILLLIIGCNSNDETPMTTTDESVIDENVSEQEPSEEVDVPVHNDETPVVDDNIEEADSPVSNDTDVITNENDDEVNLPTNPSVTVEAIADEIIVALDNQDMAAIDMYIHPDKGLLFSPYINVKPDAVVIPKQDIPTLLSNTNTFVWGTYDGIGTPISLTPADYFTEFLDMSLFLQPDDKFVNQFPGQRGNMINNLIDVFPESIPVDYFHEGTDQYSGMDWESVILVFLQDEATDYYLIAIVRDMWTI